VGHVTVRVGCSNPNFNSDMSKQLPGVLGLLRRHFHPGILRLFCLLTLLTLPNCATKRMPVPSNSEHQFPRVSDTLKVDLFFDATLSMKGFVSTKESTYYQQTIPLLERGVIEGWKGGEPSFYKFGNDIAALPGRQYLDAAKASFYADTKYNKKTFIERVIDRAQTDHLTVIITDLFQDNADVNQLSEKLKQKFISNDLAVGVLSVRSQYQGTVYDVGADNYSFAYTSNADASSGRPFYLLALGSHADIDHYFATLQQTGLNAVPEMHALIFSRFLTSQSSAFTSTRLKTAEHISEISASNVLARPYSGEQIKAFKITKSQTKAKFVTEWQYESLPSILRHSGDLNSQIESWKGEDRGGKELLPIENGEALKALTLTANLSSDAPPNEKLRMAADINVNAFPGGGIYLYQIVLRPSQFSLPTWVAEWNMSDTEIKKWHTHAPDFNGAKTYNLENFLGTLQGAVVSTTRPEVSNIYCYIKVDK